MRTCSVIAVLAAVVCLLGASRDYLFIPPAVPPPPFELDRTEFAVSDIPPGPCQLMTIVVNPDKELRRILGMQGRCIANCCTKPLQDEAIVVPPGGSAEVKFQVVASVPGPIVAEFLIYLEENGIRTVTLRVTGNAVEAPRAPK